MADGLLLCFGFGRWKRTFVRAYLAGETRRVRFCDSYWSARLRGFDADSKILVWGAREHPAVARLLSEHTVSVWRMEDGFLRSVGLGSDFVTPASLVLDKRGIYFDPGTASDLEHLLEHDEPSAGELARAAELRMRIVRTALSKYNFRGSGRPLLKPEGQRVLLVPGQVEQDASILCGCLDIRTDEQLLRETRRLNPDAYILYKPHPDVVSGNRKAGALSLDEARALADQVIVDRPLPECLAIADEVHTMTSLVGFEALLRGISVTTYGRPFYSSWGLTHDRHPLPRRTRQLTLDMLVAGVLIRYPLYLNPNTLQLASPEDVVDLLERQLEERGAPIPKAGLAHRMWRRLRVIKRVVYGS